MIIKQIDNDNLEVYAPNSLKFITDELGSTFKEVFEFYKRFFDVYEFRKLRINYFDKIEDFRNFIYDINEGDTSLPEYATATFDKGMINAYIDPKILKGSTLYYKKLYTATHELFHIMYREIILEKKNMPRVIWFDEGMAQLFSGQSYSKLDEEVYLNWVSNVISNTKEIPNLNDLEHGKGFVTDNYNGYSLGLMMVKYLYDKMDFNQFKELMGNYDEILKYGNSIKEVFKFYEDKINNNKENIFDLEYLKIKTSDNDINIIKDFDEKTKELVEYFGIKDFDKKINVVIFDNLDKFRSTLEKLIGKKVESWVNGMSLTRGMNRFIFTLNLNEARKTEGHKDFQLEDLNKLILHEFVHSCQSILSNKQVLPLWLGEGQAVYLSKQNSSISFNASFDEMVNGDVSYSNYFSMFKYVIENYGKDYTINLIKDEKLRNDVSRKLYNEAGMFYKDFFEKK